MLQYMHYAFDWNIFDISWYNILSTKEQNIVGFMYYMFQYWLYNNKCLLVFSQSVQLHLKLYVLGVVLSCFASVKGYGTF